MKITIEEIIEKYEEDYLPHVGEPIIAIINTSTITREIASAIILSESKRLAIKRLAIKRRQIKENIYLSFGDQFEVDFTGSFEIEFNNQPMIITLMVPLVFPKSN